MISTRRQFLRGLGTSIALPALPSLLTSLQAAEAAKLATTASGAPLRTAFFYFPNGSIPKFWWPDNPGQDVPLQNSLAPLDGMRGHLQVLGGLDNLSGTAGMDGAGDHARAVGTFLTGVRVNKSATDIRAGVSIDQMLARKVGHLTRHSSLELSCDVARKSGDCDSGYSCAYTYNLSWSNPTTPVPAEVSPLALFERLFGYGSHGQRAAGFRHRLAEQRSVLDFVLEDAKAMQRRLDARDNEKLDQYLTGLREVEQRIAKAETAGPPPDPNVPTPKGIPPEYGDHIQLMGDLLILAFQSDLSRVATFMLAHDGSNRSFANIGVPEGHHEISHHRDQQDLMEKCAKIDQWYVKQFAKFLQKMDAVKDSDGKSLLYNSMVVYGGGNADPNMHTHDNLPIVLAGHGGGSLTPGRYVKHNHVPTMNMMLSLADRMGVTGLERFGDSTGRLAV